MDTRKQKSIVNTQNIKRKKYKHITKESYQTTKREEKMKGTERNYKNSQKTLNKMTVSTHLSITLNVNELSYQKTQSG